MPNCREKSTPQVERPMETALGLLLRRLCLSNGRRIAGVGAYVLRPVGTEGNCRRGSLGGADEGVRNGEV